MSAHFLLLIAPGISCIFPFAPMLFLIDLANRREIVRAYRAPGA